MNTEKRKLLDYADWFENIGCKDWNKSNLQLVNQYLKEQNPKLVKQNN